MRGTVLRQLRQQRGITASALGERVGVGGKSILNIENGGKRASVELLHRIAQALGVDADEIKAAS